MGQSLEETLELCVRVRAGGENVRGADAAARAARAELGRSIQAGKAFGLSVGFLAGVAGVARASGYRFLSMAQGDARGELGPLPRF